MKKTLSLSEHVLVVLVALAAAAVIVLFAAIVQGWLFVHYWAWFVVPLGAPAVSFWHATGLATMLSLPFMKRGAAGPDKPLREHVSECVVLGLAATCVYWLGVFIHGMAF